MRSRLAGAQLLPGHAVRRARASNARAMLSLLDRRSRERYVTAHSSTRDTDLRSVDSGNAGESRRASRAAWPTTLSLRSVGYARDARLAPRQIPVHDNAHDLATLWGLVEGVPRRKLGSDDALTTRRRGFLLTSLYRLGGRKTVVARRALDGAPVMSGVNAQAGPPAAEWSGTHRGLCGA